ncbi:MAG: tRNA epoxyqueuosine(34) reductase QueG [Ilumatobacter coccineus]|uniref:tRNA epoxyqueuosine(34) reductase QueG n=1 Tax=Ilumatobacter coccineus TaxID=467094 RepID=A0A2G6KBI4_9ACTN|nr:MAG: tRNA epoxyqueuosine(34) reductase QueG [Ilumatobacter coccineus]
MSRRHPLPTWDEIVDLAADAGITRLGVAPAEILTDARHTLHARKADGLHAGMAFTYRNPDRSTDPFRTLDDARSIIVAARPYQATEEPDRPDGVQGRVGRYAWTDHYTPLRLGLRSIVRRIKAAGYRAVAFADDNSVVDREVAYRGGIGWYGKNSNILVPGAGSYFVLGSIITNADYPVSEPEPNRCGKCHRCLDGCPTAAIVAPGVIDANRCLAWLVQQPGDFPEEFRAALGDRIYGCDECQEVCPPSIRFGDHHRVTVDAPEAWIDLLDLLEGDDDAILARHWYIAQRDPVWVRRNALIVVGNTADPGDRRARAIVERYRAHSVLGEIARWADDQLDKRQAI